jgi:hypothetical protein
MGFFKYGVLQIWGSSNMGFFKSDLVLSFFLFICIRSKKSALVQLINYQLFNLLLSLKLKSHIPETNSHFTPEQWICALGDLTMCNLAYLNESVRLPSVSKKIALIYLFFILGWRSDVLGYCPSPHVTLWVLYVAPAFQELAKQIISFVGCSQGFWLKDLWSNDLLPFINPFEY